jgi:hypothetical protein
LKVPRLADRWRSPARGLGHLWDALGRTFDVLGFADATGGYEVFRGLVLARVIEPSSKLDSLRVLDEAGIDRPSYPTLTRRLPIFATEAWQQALGGGVRGARRAGPASLVLYDVSVRHEALVVRVEVIDHHRGRGRGRGREAGGSLTGETFGRVGAAPAKPCRVSTVGWRERGERAEEVYARNRTLAGAAGDDPEAGRQVPPVGDPDRDRPGRAAVPEDGAGADLRGRPPAGLLRVPAHAATP